MAFDVITSSTFKITSKQTAKKAQAGLNLRSETDVVGNEVVWTLGTGATQFNEAYIALLTIVGAGSQTIDLQILVDVLGNDLIFTAVKSIFIQLLGTADLTPDGVTTGSACSGITIGNATSNRFSAPISDSSTGVITLANREQFGRCLPSAAGWTVDATHKDLKFLNNDAVVSAKILVALQGLG